MARFWPSSLFTFLWTETGKGSFVYSCLQMRPMGQHNGKWPICLVHVSKPMIIVIELWWILIVCVSETPWKTVTVISGTLWKYTLCHATLKKTNSFLTNAFKQPNKFTSLVSGHLAILSPSTTFLAEAKSKANAMSAVASDRIPGVFPTAILRSLAANKSIWLTPTPTLLITLRFGNKSMKSASILLCFEE